VDNLAGIFSRPNKGDSMVEYNKLMVDPKPTKKSKLYLGKGQEILREAYKVAFPSEPLEIRLYVVEEQEILREVYQTAFSTEPTIDLLGMTGGADGEEIVNALSTLNPDTVLLGTKMLQPSVTEKLEMIRESHPQVGIVLLSTLYDIKGIKTLREFTKRNSKRCAFLLKHSIDRIDQLIQVIHAVTEGQVILDPLVMEGLIGAGEPEATFLKELTNREMEVLSWMAKGYRNMTIAELLYVDPKTIERHINSIYSKLNGEADSMHPRVNSIMLYLKATAQLVHNDIVEAPADRKKQTLSHMK